MFHINPKQRAMHFMLIRFIRSVYHFARLITKIEETKFKEKIIVDQKQDLTGRRFGVDDISVDDGAEALMMELVCEEER